MNKLHDDQELLIIVGMASRTIKSIIGLLIWTITSNYWSTLSCCWSLFVSFLVRDNSKFGKNITVWKRPWVSCLEMATLTPFFSYFLKRKKMGCPRSQIIEEAIGIKRPIPKAVSNILFCLIIYSTKNKNKK